MVGRGRQHALEQRPVAGLELGALLELPLRHPHPLGERVAQRLELTEPQQTRRPGDRRHRGIDRGVPETLRDQLAEPPLEAADLAPQLRPREALVSLQARQQRGISQPHTHKGSLARDLNAFSLYISENA